MSTPQKKSEKAYRRAFALGIMECEEAQARTAAVKGMQKKVTIELLYRDGMPISVKIGNEKYSDMKVFLADG